MRRLRLNSEDRAFFAALCEAMWMNPFSAKRAELMRQLGSTENGNTWSIDPHAYEMTEEVNRRVQRIEAEGGHSLDCFVDEDQTLMQRIFLYHIYHSLVPEFDRFIVAQIRDSRPGRDVPFAKDALARILQRGFNPDEALRYFALAYQLRRAFYFIVVSLVGISDSIRRLREQLWSSVFTFDLVHYQRSFIGRLEDFSTLLLGATGTGKGQAAAAIGRSGFIPFNPSSNSFVEDFRTAFVATNLSRFSETLIESELFGHRKGAFTGAIGDHKGLFERCSALGSLFLDEIGDVSGPVQVKLLDVLQDRTFCRVGDSTARRFEGRVITATNRPLKEFRGGGNIRDDFFYRLSSNIVHVPSLRQRLDDSSQELELLVSSLVTRTVDQSDDELTGFVLERINKKVPNYYEWPGNVRELEQAVRSILMTGEYAGNPLTEATDPEAALVRSLRNGEIPAEALVDRYCALLYARIGTFEGVAQRVGLDRRTVKAHVEKDKARESAERPAPS